MLVRAADLLNRVAPQTDPSDFAHETNARCGNRISLLQTFQHNVHAIM